MSGGSSCSREAGGTGRVASEGRLVSPRDSAETSSRGSTCPTWDQKPLDAKGGEITLEFQALLIRTGLVLILFFEKN